MNRFLMLLAVVLFTVTACKQNPSENTVSKSTIDIPLSGETETQEIVNPPFVPKPVGDRAAKKVIINLETTEIEGELADGVTYKFWTFNNTVP